MRRKLFASMLTFGVTGVLLGQVVSGCKAREATKEVPPGVPDTTVKFTPEQAAAAKAKMGGPGPKEGQGAKGDRGIGAGA